MDRTLFRVAAVLATAVLAIASSEARAETGEEALDAGTTGAEQAPAADAEQAAEAPAAPSDGGTQTEAAADLASAPTDSSAPLDESPAATGSDQAQQPTLTAAAPPAGSTDATAPAATGGSEATSGTSPSDSAALNPAADPAAESTTTALPEEPAAAPTDLLTFTVAEAPASPTDPQAGPVTTVPAPAPLEPIGADLAEARPPLDIRDEALPELLPRVERELRSVQVQMEELQRHLVEGTPPPTSDLTRLRRSLEWIAPALLALEVHLEATGLLSPRLRQILRRVRTRLRGTHASAGNLIAALRDSGLHGYELRLLLRELESFGALDVVLHWSPAAPPAAALAGSAAHAAYTQPPQAAAQQSATAAPEPRATARSTTAGSPDRGGVGEPPPWSPASGSASAGPGGAFFAAGLASLAALLIALALPRLWSRIELPRSRRYAVVFLAPLERPG